MNTLLRNLYYRLMLWLWRKHIKSFKWSPSFPTSQGKNYLYEPLFAGPDGEAYFTKLYAEEIANPYAIDFRKFRLEILKGRRNSAGTKFKLNVGEPSALPYAVVGSDPIDTETAADVTLTCNGQSFQFRNLVSERFYYLPIREAAEVELQSRDDLIIGNPIPLRQAKPHKRRLVMVLFIDCFASDVLERISFERDLPNLHRFFSKGCIFENCYSGSNWTIPGVATIVSGQPLIRHRMYHPRQNNVVGTGYPILSELLQRDGYLTFQACGNWRKTPSYGYVKGFDRTVFRSQLNLPEAIHATIDHLRAFPERDNFLWLSIFDAHHHLAHLPDVANQLAAPLQSADYFEEAEKTPLQLRRDEARIYRYIEELKRIDYLLGPMLNLLETEYAEDELLVAAVSDHGTGYLTDDRAELKREKVRVPFMIRGAGITPGASGEIVQNTDILPSLLHFAGITCPPDVSGRLPERLGGASQRSYALSEIMYPGAPYTATIKDTDYEFYFEAGAVKDDGSFAHDAPKVSLFRRDDSKTDLANSFPELVARYTQVVRDHIASPAA